MTAHHKPKPLCPDTLRRVARWAWEEAGALRQLALAQLGDCEQLRCRADELTNFAAVGSVVVLVSGKAGGVHLSHVEVLP
jgi:hypothetical protein